MKVVFIIAMIVTIFATLIYPTRFGSWSFKNLIMKSLLKISACIFFSGMLIFTSCKKESTQAITPTPSGNKPPIANAGVDQTIILPNTIIGLDGRGSTDPDNNITNYLWTNISGAIGFTIANATAAQT